MGKQVAAGTFEGGIAQLGEHLLCKQGVKGSNPFISTQIARKVAISRPGRRIGDRTAIGGVRFTVSPRDRRTVQGRQDESIQQDEEVRKQRSVPGTPLCTLKIAYKSKVKTFCKRKKRHRVKIENQFSSRSKDLIAKNDSISFEFRG